MTEAKRIEVLERENAQLRIEVERLRLLKTPPVSHLKFAWCGLVGREVMGVSTCRGNMAMCECRSGR